MDKGGSETTTQENAPPAYLVPYMQDYLSNSAGLAGQPYQQSPFPQNAPINDYQNTAFQLMYDQAINGDPASNSGRAAIAGIASGNQANPWQGFAANTAAGNNTNPFMQGLMGFGGQNPFMSGMQSMAAGEANPNMIDPQAFIDATSKDMTRGAKEGVMAQTDAAFNRSGAYGGSAYSQMQADNSNALADSIGQMSSGARISAAGHNANLWQQQQQNRLGAMGMGNQAFLGGQNNQLQAMLGGGNLYDSGIGRQLQATGLGGQMFNQDVGNMLGAAQTAPQYAQMDSNAFQNLLGAGNQMQNYQQGLLGSMNGEFQNQVQYPYKMNDYMGQSLNNMMGNYGSQTQTAPGEDQTMNTIGTIASVAAMFF